MENIKLFIAGWGAGILGVIVGYPLDTIKTYQQISNVKLSTRKVIVLILKKHGFQGMYTGMLFPLLCSGCLHSLYFGVFGISMTFLQSIHGNNKICPNNPTWKQDLLIAGSIAGALQAFISCPSELIKIRMQLRKGVSKNKNFTKDFIKYPSNYQTILDIYRKFGIHSFFVGFLPTMLRDSFNGGLYISSYQYTRHYMYGELNLNPGLFETLVAGGIAGIVSWIPVIPFDTIKSRIQADNFRDPVYKGMIDCIANLFKDSHYLGFFKGFTMITIRSIPVNISIMYSYEIILWFFKKFDIFVT